MEPAPIAEHAEVMEPVAVMEDVAPALAISPGSLAANPEFMARMANESTFALLAERRPEWAEALATYRDDPVTLADAAEVLLAADPRLVDLLLPVVPNAGVPDRTGEDVRVDLLAASAHLEGNTLVGWIQGVGVAENGGWLAVDIGGGPALDLQFGFGNAWSREATLDRSQATSAMVTDVIPEVVGNTVHFEVDLSRSSRFEPGHSGAAVAMVKAFDGSIHDVGPAGILGEPSTESFAVLAAIVESQPVVDADLAVALAVTFGTLRSIVADNVVETVDADAVEWLHYGESLDTWLEEQKAEWSFSTLNPLGKLVWAWPAAQAVAYGAFPLSAQANLLSADEYRFVVPDVASLQALRDGAPLRESAAETATAIDVSTWSVLRYRASDDLMTTLCANDGLDRRTCRAWRADRTAGVDLGTVAGQRVPIHEGVSSTLQLDILEHQGEYIGDCATATTLVMNTMQSVGLPALAMGWSGSDLATPTHDVPLWFDGDRFRGTQRGPPKEWRKDTAFVYLFLPGVHPENAFALASEPHGWSRGGSVAGGWTTFREVEALLRDGLPADVVGGWIDVQAAGGWPTW